MPETPPAPTRRARLRESTESDIKAAALAQIAAEGAPALSLRAVARAIGMSPAGLYRYYDGRDALLTALLVDAYADLAATVEAATAEAAPSAPDAPAADAPAADVPAPGAAARHRARFLAGVHAYRAWAIADPNRFLLIFGTPIPGYAAPEDGLTVAANRRMGAAFFRVAAAAHADGVLRTPAPSRRPTDVERQIAEDLGPGFPAGAVADLLGAWAHFHGLVLLEITGQLDWAYDDTGAYVAAQAEGIAGRLIDDP